MKIQKSSLRFYSSNSDEERGVLEEGYNKCGRGSSDTLLDLLAERDLD